MKKKNSKEKTASELVFPIFCIIYQTVTVLLHSATAFRIFIKSPEEGRLDCPKYRENQLARRFFFAAFFYYPRLN